VARVIVESTDPTAPEAKSGTEDHYFDLLVEMGYPPPERNYKVRGSYGFDWEIDLYYPPTQQGFERSPYDTHMSPEANSRDGHKILDLSAMGLQIITITDGVSDADFCRQARKILGPPEAFPREMPPFEKPA
jgi:hypothetical protein